MSLVRKFLNYVTLILVITYAGYILFWDKTSQKQVQQGQASTKQIEELVNKNLQELSRQMISEQVERKILEQKALEAAKNIKVSKNVESDLSHPIKEQIHKADLSSFSQNQVQKTTPVYRELSVSEMNPAQKKEYARQYIENARKAGFHIELDENLEVKSATSIRQPSQSYDSIEILPSN